MSLRINLVYEKLLPKMTEEEFAQLKISIQEEGQHYPIIANEDLEVLDGHHRFRACTELGIVAREEIEMIFYSNAAQLIASIEAWKQTPTWERL